MLVSQETIAAQINKHFAQRAEAFSQLERLKVSAKSREDILLDKACLEHDLESTSPLLDIDHWLPESCQCSYCGEALSLPFIYWCHPGLNTAYHLSCAERWLPSLGRDINEFRLGRSKANEILATAESRPVCPASP